MNVRDLVPWNREARERALVPSTSETFGPFMNLQREMNRLFDDVFRGVGSPGLGVSWPSVSESSWPRMEVLASDNEYKVTAELPGMNQDDVDVLFEDGVLILRGERKVESEDQARAFSERYYGRFERRIEFDRAVDEGKISASFANGLLTVIVPKTAKSEERARRIAINASPTAH